MSSLRDVPICKRGFLTSVKKSPELPIHKLAQHAEAVCNGLQPDYNGRKFKSPHHQIKDLNSERRGKKTDPSKEKYVRPLLPTYEQLSARNCADKRFKKDIVLKSTIIGVADVEGRLHLVRPIKRADKAN